MSSLSCGGEPKESLEQGSSPAEGAPRAAVAGTEVGAADAVAAGVAAYAVPRIMLTPETVDCWSSAPRERRARASAWTLLPEP